MIWLWLLLILPESAFPQDERVTPPTLLVGVMVAPPLYMKTADGRWEGIGIEVWQAVAQRIGVSFEYREYNSFGNLLDAIKNET